jgi:hypothetical protein
MKKTSGISGKYFAFLFLFFCKEMPNETVEKSNYGRQERVRARIYSAESGAGERTGSK